MEGLLIHLHANRLKKAVSCRQHGGVLVRRRCGQRRHDAFAVLEYHRQHTLREIAEIIGKVAIHPMDHRPPREVSVIAERHFPHQEIACLVEAELVRKPVRIDDIAKRFRDFLAFIRPPSMREHATRKRKTGGHQESRPVNGMEPEDVLADHMQVGRPEPAVALGIAERAVGRPSCCGDIVRQRIEPDIHHMRVVVRHRNAPGEARAADRQVAQPAFDEALHLVEP